MDWAEFYEPAYSETMLASGDSQTATEASSESAHPASRTAIAAIRA